jgi:hypothetical protein
VGRVREGVDIRIPILPITLQTAKCSLTSSIAFAPFDVNRPENLVADWTAIRTLDSLAGQNWPLSRLPVNQDLAPVLRLKNSGNDHQALV